MRTRPAALRLFLALPADAERMWDDDWLALVVLGGLCALSLLWTAAAAPRFRVSGLHVLLTGPSARY